MTGLRLAATVLLILLLQLVFIDKIAILGIRPDLTIVLLTFLSLRRGPVTGTILGFGLGLLQDLLVQSTLGMNMLAKSVVGYLMGKLSGNLLVGGLPLYAALVGLSVLLHDMLYLLAYTRLDIPRFLMMFITQSVPTALYTAVVASVLMIAGAALSGGRLLSPVEEGR